MVQDFDQTCGPFFLSWRSLPHAEEGGASRLEFENYMKL